MPEALKKTTGTMVAFGDVVQLSKERSQDPEADGFERYIGLEHLEPSELKVRRWGDISDGVTFTSVFRPGHVLFGKRRAYQRKVAVAEFSGVCSGDIYVLEPTGDQLLPGLLPFICQSEPFYDYVMSMSQGGLSPRVNWKALAKYEFFLPALEEQRRIAAVLQAVEAFGTQLQSLAVRTAKLLEADLVSTLNHGPDPLREQPRLPSGWTFTTLGDLISVRHGFAFDGKCFTEEATEDPLLLTPGNFSESGELEFSDGKTKRFNGDIPDGFWLQPGDLVVLMTDLTPTAFLLGVPGVVSESTGPILQNQRIGLLANLEPERVSDKFLFYSFLGQQLRRMIRALSAGTTVHHTSPKDICSLRIPLPPREEQSALCRRWDAIANARLNAVARLRRIRAIQRDLLSSALQGGEQ